MQALHELDLDQLSFVSESLRILRNEVDPQVRRRSSLHTEPLWQRHCGTGHNRGGKRRSCPDGASGAADTMHAFSLNATRST